MDSRSLVWHGGMEKGFDGAICRNVQIDRWIFPSVDYNVDRMRLEEDVPTVRGEGKMYELNDTHGDDCCDSASRCIEY